MLLSVKPMLEVHVHTAPCWPKCEERMSSAMMLSAKTMLSVSSHAGA